MSRLVCIDEPYGRGSRPCLWLGRAFNQRIEIERDIVHAGAAFLLDIELCCDGFVAIEWGVLQGYHVMLRSPGGACHVLGWGLAFLLLPASGHAQSVESFYRAKTLSMVIGYPTGGSNDIYARSVARHIGKHIPGNPTVVPRNMPGGGSLVAANHVFNVAPKDGTTLALIAATIPLEERLGAPNVMFKSAAFNWIGRVAAGVNMTFVMNSVLVKTIQDTFTREVVLGASGRSSTVAIYPAVLSNVIGTRFKL